MRDRHVCGGRSHRGECAADAGNDVRSEALRGEGPDEHEDSDQDGAERESDEEVTKYLEEEIYPVLPYRVEVGEKGGCDVEPKCGDSGEGRAGLG